MHNTETTSASRKVERAQAYFAEELTKYRTEAAALSADGREDEAVFAKIRASVGEIFPSLLNAAQSAAPGDEGNFVQKRAAQLIASWNSARQRAEQHGDEARAHIETIKLETVAALEAGFCAIWEVQL